MQKTLIAVCFVVFGAACVLGDYYGNSDAMLLSNVKALTFTKGQMTRGRRSAPIPQLECVGGTAQGRYDFEPSVVQCINMGEDSYGNIQWKCEASLDDSVQFGRTDVSCEGYSHPDDPYILAGSCGLQYELQYTDKGRQRTYNSNSHYGGQYNYNHYEGSNTSGGVARFIILAAFAFIVFGLVRQCMINAQASGSSFGNNGYGSGYGTGGPGFPPGGPGYGPGPGYGSGYPGNGCNPPPPPSYGGNTWRPGFWTGLGTGGLLSYFFRPRNYGYSTFNTGYSNYGYGPSYRPSYGSFGSSSFGSTASSPSTSRTSTGYGGTRRR